MSAIADWFEDSKALCDRAKRHYDEFQDIVGRNADPSLWEIKEWADEGAETFTYGLLLNWEVLAQVKPVAADVANNLVHSLDQLVGAAARLRGRSRDRNLYFPWVLDEVAFERKLPVLESFIGSRNITAIREVRERHRLWLPQIHAVKEISNSGKHWALIPSNASAAAVAVNLPGKPQKIWQVPPDAFHAAPLYEFAVNVPRLVNVPFHIVIRLDFDGLGDGVPASPDTIFDCAFRYVRDMIAAVEAS
jgi:hypothetical protein